MAGVMNDSTAGWWKDHAEALDRNWQAHHDASMGAVREALGMPDGAVAEMVEEILRLKAVEREVKCGGAAALDRDHVLELERMAGEGCPHGE